MLALMGFDPGPLDGILGPLTDGAVRQAFAFFAQSPLTDVRRAVAAGPDALRFVSQAIGILSFAARGHAGIAASLPGPARLSPVAPDEELAMDPAAAAALEKKMLGGGGFPWGPIVAAGGVTLAVGAVVLAVRK